MRQSTLICLLPALAALGATSPTLNGVPALARRAHPNMGPEYVVDKRTLDRRADADTATDYAIDKRADADTATDYAIDKRADADTATDYAIDKRADADTATDYAID